MKTRFGLITLVLFSVCAVAVPVSGQSSADQSANSQTNTVRNKKSGRSPGGDVASGTGDIGKGAAKGAGSAAKGVGKGAVDLVTLHPIDAATSVGKGGVTAGKDVAVGTTKGTGKVVKGVARGIKHLF